MFKRFRSCLLALFAFAAVLACVASVAEAGLTVKPGSFAVTTSSDQAGAHADLTTSFAFATDNNGSTEGILRNVEVDLPVGFAGYPTAIGACTPNELELIKCPVDSQVGSIELRINFGGGPNPVVTPVYNMAPAPGETAVLGFIVSQVVAADIVVSVRPDYGLRATVTNVVSPFEVDGQTLTLWGVPADPSHDALRGAECFFGSCEHGGKSSGVNPAPFLTNPTRCTSETLTAELRVSSWQNPEPQTETTNVAPFAGCEHLDFGPTISVRPETSQAASPSGYRIDLKVPANQEPEGLATADLRNAVVSFPAGVVLSPSAANGLQACTDTQFGLGNGEPVGCPAASKIGDVTLTTPAFTDTLSGGLYLGGPLSGPITGPPYRVLLTLAGHGLLVKVAGSVQPDPLTGQLTAAFDESPQLPFSELALQLEGGARAPLANPSACGAFTTATDLTPWSSPFTPDAAPFSTFEITGCSSPRFAPSFVAGTTSNHAGGFSPFTLTFSRTDADQQLTEISVQTPPGLLGMLSNVTLCPEPQASQGTCGPHSLIGRTTVGAGPGSDPFYVAGNVFLTGPYKGAPFGLSMVVPALAGPFNLGTVVVRAAINVDPYTSQLTVTSDPLPTILQGVPLDLRTVNVTINRPEFIFNPTNCSPLAVNATITSTAGARAGVWSHFQAANCATLPFKPRLTAMTQAKASKASGASLHVKVVSGSGQANIAKVRVLLPKALPARLTTLQKACVDSVFEANPAGCPAGSVVGTGTAVTPVLKNALSGPAYLVSHAGAAFPDLVIVLQGEGITLRLVGNTDIKGGITASTFSAVPDAPISTFDLVLPQGPHSALGANGSLCSTALDVPTTITGQNGAVLRQTTKIAVAGCHRARKAGKSKVGGKARQGR